MHWTHFQPKHFFTAKPSEKQVELSDKAHYTSYSTNEKVKGDESFSRWSTMDWNDAVLVRLKCPVVSSLVRYSTKPLRKTTNLPYIRRHWSTTLVNITFFFHLLVSGHFCFIYLLPLLWLLPMSIHVHLPFLFEKLPVVNTCTLARYQLQSIANLCYLVEIIYDHTWSVLPSPGYIFGRLAKWNGINYCNFTLHMLAAMFNLGACSRDAQLTYEAEP